MVNILKKIKIKNKNKTKCKSNSKNNRKLKRKSLNLNYCIDWIKTLNFGHQVIRLNTQRVYVETK